MRILIVSLLLGACSLAQSKADFSGIFLRTTVRTSKDRPKTPVPRILEIRQTADEIVATVEQCGETAAAHYSLHGGKEDIVQAQLSEKNLVLKRRAEPHLNPAELSDRTSSVAEERWELSPDHQQLVIRSKGLFDSSDIYVRESSLSAAQQEASSRRRDCAGPTAEWLSGTEPKTQPIYVGAARVGWAAIDQVTQRIFYDAVLSGDFFKNLQRTENAGQAQFHRTGKSVADYTGELVLEVDPGRVLLHRGWVYGSKPGRALRWSAICDSWCGGSVLRSGT